MQKAYKHYFYLFFFGHLHLEPMELVCSLFSTRKFKKKKERSPVDGGMSVSVDRTYIYGMADLDYQRHFII